VAGKVVEDHHVALLRRRGELGLEIGVEDQGTEEGKRPNTSYGTEMLHMAIA
jgi:hypothetical protein